MENKYIQSPQTVGIVSAGFSKFLKKYSHIPGGGQPKGGVEHGPSRCLDAGLISQVEQLGWKVHLDAKIPLTYEHLKPAPSDSSIHSSNGHHEVKQPVKLKNVRYVSAVAKDVMKNVSNTCKQGHLALTIGGDHSLALGTISGSLSVYPDIGVLWDINTPETTTSGNLHGMPLSFLTGIAAHPSFDEWLPTARLPLSRLVYIGLRDVDKGEKEILKKLNIRAYSMHHVDRFGIGKVVDMALDYLGRDRPIHLSFDVDALDPSVCPSTGTPVRGGLTFREGHYICEWRDIVIVEIQRHECTSAIRGVSCVSSHLMNELTQTEKKYFMGLKVPQLKTLVESLGLSSSGYKAEIVARLLNYVHASITEAQRSKDWKPVQQWVNQIQKLSVSFFLLAKRLGLTFPELKVSQTGDWTSHVGRISLPQNVTGPIVNTQVYPRLVAPTTSAPQALDLYHFKKPCMYHSVRRLFAQVAPPQSQSLTIQKLALGPVELDNLKDPRKGYQVRVFIGNPDLVRPPSKLNSLRIQLPPACLTFVNGHRLYQEKYLILNANTDHKFIPASITSYLRFEADATNTIAFRFTPVSHKVLVVVELTRDRTVEERVEYICSECHLTKEEYMKQSDFCIQFTKTEQKATVEDEDLTATSEIVTLRDPLSLSRIVKAARSNLCNHTQCFDLLTFFTLNEKADQLVCPICNQIRSWSSLIFDGFFDDILKSAGDYVGKVQIWPDGKWEKVVEKEKPRRESRRVSFALDEDSPLMKTRVTEFVQQFMKPFSTGVSQDQVSGFEESLISQLTEWTSTHMPPSLKRRKISTRSPGEVIDLDHFTASPPPVDSHDTEDVVFVLD